jgi:hypothetical protein
MGAKEVPYQSSGYRLDTPEFMGKFTELLKLSSCERGIDRVITWDKGGFDFQLGVGLRLPRRFILIRLNIIKLRLILNMKLNIGLEARNIIQSASRMSATKGYGYPEETWDEAAFCAPGLSPVTSFALNGSWRNASQKPHAAITNATNAKAEMKSVTKRRHPVPPTVDRDSRPEPCFFIGRFPRDATRTVSLYAH